MEHLSILFHQMLVTDDFPITVQDLLTRLFILVDTGKVTIDTMLLFQRVLHMIENKDEKKWIECVVQEKISVYSRLSSMIHSICNGYASDPNLTLANLVTELTEKPRMLNTSFERRHVAAIYEGVLAAKKDD